MAYVPTYNALRICVMFVESTEKAHYCYEVSKSLGIPTVTAFNTLNAMASSGWIEKRETEDNLSAGPPRVLYNLTESGLKEAVDHLRELRVPITGYKASA